mmetsp:Transcript_22452/g.51519  ORF Transcript_22452/g.51519 Transcript_22452/m.51519 type:complete len:323 (-) Transcript_22452:416-1384(-)
MDYVSWTNTRTCVRPDKRPPSGSAPGAWRAPPAAGRGRKLTKGVCGGAGSAQGRAVDHASATEEAQTASALKSSSSFGTFQKQSLPSSPTLENLAHCPPGAHAWQVARPEMQFWWRVLSELPPPDPSPRPCCDAISNLLKAALRAEAPCPCPLALFSSSSRLPSAHLPPFRAKTVGLLSCPPHTTQSSDKKSIRTCGRPDARTVSTPPDPGTCPSWHKTKCTAESWVVKARTLPEEEKATSCTHPLEGMVQIRSPIFFIGASGPKSSGGFLSTPLMAAQNMRTVQSVEPAAMTTLEGCQATVSTEDSKPSTSLEIHQLFSAS